MSSATARPLDDGRRLHLQHGPIDLIIEAVASEAERALAYRQAERRFRSVLEELVGELPTLRRPVGQPAPEVRGPVARRMVAAVWPHRQVFVTPMAAVAGAVADEVLDAMLRGRRVRRAYVNNGGDIALHLAPGERLVSAVVERIDQPGAVALLEVTAASPVRGLATSGWRGRSLSLGIADAVTVLAVNAAAADAAATLIGNAVDAEHPSVRRQEARHLRDDSDLGDLPVTVQVGDLPREMVAAALDRGAVVAETMRRQGLIWSARAALRGQVRQIGPVTLSGEQRRCHERLRPAAQDHDAIRGNLP